MRRKDRNSYLLSFYAMLGMETSSLFHYLILPKQHYSIGAILPNLQISPTVAK